MTAQLLFVSCMPYTQGKITRALIVTNHFSQWQCSFQLKAALPLAKRDCDNVTSLSVKWVQHSTRARSPTSCRYFKTFFLRPDWLLILIIRHRMVIGHNLCLWCTVMLAKIFFKVLTCGHSVHLEWWIDHFPHEQKKWLIFLTKKNTSGVKIDWFTMKA